MKITFDVKNQILSRTDRQYVIANSTDYLEAEITFSEDWADLEKNMQFVSGDNKYTFALEQDGAVWKIAQNQHLNLGIGTWKASIIGVGGDKRIVTNEANIAIRASGWIGVGGPIPSVYEQLLTIIQSLHTEVASSAVIRSAVQQYIVDNFDALVKEVVVVGDVQEIIDDMVEDGTISALLDQVIAGDVPGAVTDWLEDHVDPDTGYVIDNTLTTALAAADAKATGDAITNLKSALTQKAWEFGSKNRINPNTLTENYAIAKTGVVAANNSYDVSDYIPLTPGATMYNYGIAKGSFAFFGSDKTVLSDNNTPNLTNPFTVPNNVYYIRISVKPENLATAYLSTQDSFDAYKTIQQYVHDGFSAVDADLAKFELSTTWINDIFIKTTDGTEASNSSYKATGYIRIGSNSVTEIIRYNLKLFENTAIAYYDKDKVFISAYAPASASLIVVEGVINPPSNAAYVRFSCAKNYDGKLWMQSIVPKEVGESENPCDYGGNEIAVFNKGLCIGDSLTTGTMNYYQDGSRNHTVQYAKYSYPTYLSKLTGIEITNKGSGGKTSAEWYELFGNDDLSGYDFAIIQLGVNDQIRYGSFDVTSQTAFENIITKLETENKNIKIYFANIVPALSYSTEGLLEFSDDLLAWAETYSQTHPNVIPVDIQQYGHTHSLSISGTSDPYNCGHLSALGYERLAQDYKSFISWHINEYKEQYKEVQFIGTDYYYDIPS